LEEEDFGLFPITLHAPPSSNQHSNKSKQNGIVEINEDISDSIEESSKVLDDDDDDKNQLKPTSSKSQDVKN
jgi:hypothetical protein